MHYLAIQSDKFKKLVLLFGNDQQDLFVCIDVQSYDDNKIFSNDHNICYVYFLHIYFHLCIFNFTLYSHYILYSHIVVPL